MITSKKKLDDLEIMPPPPPDEILAESLKDEKSADLDLFYKKAPVPSGDESDSQSRAETPETPETPDILKDEPKIGKLDIEAYNPTHKPPEEVKSTEPDDLPAGNIKDKLAALQKEIGDDF